MNTHFCADEEMRLVYLFNICDLFTDIVLYMGNLLGLRVVEEDCVLITQPDMFVFVKPGIGDRIRLFTEAFHR